MDQSQVISLTVTIAIVLLLGIVIMGTVLFFLFKNLLKKQNTPNGIAEQISAMDNATRASFERLSGTMGSLQKSAEQMAKVGEDVGALQNLLKPPKFRGSLGETMLNELLSQIIPNDFYKTQYSFKTGSIVDAVIRVGNKIVPVDAKFPLEGFQEMVDNNDSDQVKKMRRKFDRAIKKHIDDISSKYILPDEHTYDFALMYIPAENIYYETIIKAEDSDLLSYAADKHVIPVSPNSFYAYLQVIALGLRGLHIEERANEIMGDLKRLQGDQSKFREAYDTLGKHLNNARNKHEEGGLLLGRFEDKLLNIAEEVEPQNELEG